MPKFDSAGYCTDPNAVNLTNSVTYCRKRGPEVCPLHLSTKLPLFKFEHHVLDQQQIINIIQTNFFDQFSDLHIMPLLLALRLENTYLKGI